MKNKKSKKEKKNPKKAEKRESFLVIPIPARQV